jgi:hypothetical protein
MRTLKDIRANVNNPRPLTDEERSTKRRRSKMRREARDRLMFANSTFKDKPTEDKPLTEFLRVDK